MFKIEYLLLFSGSRNALKIKRWLHNSSITNSKFKSCGKNNCSKKDIYDTAISMEWLSTTFSDPGMWVAETLICQFCCPMSKAVLLHKSDLIPSILLTEATAVLLSIMTLCIINISYCCIVHHDPNMFHVFIVFEKTKKP